MVSCYKKKLLKLIAKLNDEQIYFLTQFVNSLWGGR